MLMSSRKLMPLRRSKRVTNSSLPKSNTPLMLRAVGVGVGRRCYLRGSRIAVKEERGSWGLRLPYLPLPLLEGRPSQCRCSSTFHAPKSSHIDIPQTSKSSLASLPSGSSVKVAGWLISRRRIGKSLSFAVLLLPRGQGRLQLIARSEEGSGEENENIAVWDEAGNHGVVLVEGQLQCKPSKDVRQEQEKSNPLSHLELHISNTKILNGVPTGTLPFDPLHDYRSINETVRMKHRYLDLRGDRLGHNIRQRSKVSWTIRNYLHQLDFTEIETPVLLRSTPEGAREYLVPTRNNQKQTSHSSDASSSSLPVKRPQFFALQQSPQQPKQLLIASGVTDRYFQIAKCFRDEDGRKDRQAEFTQIDLEMGFVSGAEVFKKEDGWRIGGREIRQVIEGMIKTIWRAVGRHEEADELDREGFLVMQYDEAMQRYGSDKPDLRYGVELVDMGDAIKGEGEGTDGFRPKSELELLCFTPPNGSFTNAEMGELFGTNPDLLEGVESFKVEAGSINSMAKLLMRKSRNMRDLLTEKEVTGEEVSVTSLVRKLQEAQDKGLIAQGVEKGDISYLFTALKKLPASGGSTKLGDLRRLLIASLVEKGKVTLPSKPHFAWITEFPLFTLDDGDKAQLSQGRWSSSHHPFTSPMEEDIPRIQQALCDDAMVSREEKEMIMHTCKGQHYDLVLNGVEIGGGSIRIHDTSLQRDILKNALELSSTELNRFNHLLQALACGAPPHGGIALGFDRLMAILCDTATIRDVMAFPKSATSKDLLFQCPDSLEQDSLLEAYGLRSASPSSSNE